MTSRSEALLEALQQIGSSVEGSGAKLEAAIGLLENSNYEHAADMRHAFEGHGESLERAAESHGRSIESLGTDIRKAGRDIESGLEVIGIFCLVGIALVAQAGAITAGLEQMKSNRQYVQMVDSILELQSKYGAMNYKFVLKRSFAEGSTKGQRRTILNGLIFSGVVNDCHNSIPNQLFIDEASDAYLNFRDWESEAFKTKLLG